MHCNEIQDEQPSLTKAGDTGGRTLDGLYEASPNDEKAQYCAEQQAAAKDEPREAERRLGLSPQLH